MSKLQDDRGAAERAMLYKRPSSAQQISNTSNNNNQQQSQIIKLLEQVRNRLTDIDKERSELWEAIGDQTKILGAIEDRSTSTEKTFISLENRLSRTELNEAPLSERIDEIERIAKESNAEDQEDIRREMIERLEESDLQTARLIERIDESMAMQTRMTRRIDKVVQDKQRLNRKISLLEESIDATRHALASKALVLLSDHGVVSQTDAPSIPLFHETKQHDPIFETEEKEIQKDHAAFIPPQSQANNSFTKQAITVAAFAIIAGTAGWFISKNINSQPQDREIVRFEESVAQAPASVTTTQPPQASTSYQAATTNRYEPAGTFDFNQNIPSIRTFNNRDQEEIAAALNNIEPSTNTFAEPDQTIVIEESQPVQEAQQSITVTKNTSATPSVFVSDKDLPDNLKSAEAEAFKGNAEAQHDLAVIYTAGRDNVPQNFERAAYWFEKASNQGIANARYNLGVLYHQGLGVDQDLEKAIDWYQQAAALGHGEAQYNLGIAYIEGIGVQYDPSLAAQYFQSAAATGVPEAAFNLGLIYENGLTGTAQPQEAILWYKTASDLGNPDAKNAIDQLAKTLNISAREIDAIVEKIKTPQIDKQSQLSATKNISSFENSNQIISQIQNQLMAFGLYPGPADGSYGPLTEDAIRLYQKRHEMAVNGQASEDLLVHMMTKTLRNTSFVELGSGE